MISFRDLVSIETRKYKFTMLGFWQDPHIEGEMNDGYILHYRDMKNSKNDFTGKCLDADHVHRELTYRGIDSQLTEFIIGFC